MKNIHIRKRQRRITISDLETLAQLCECERLNYREACGVLGLNYDSWRNWKERAENEARYSDIVARVKGAWLKGRLDNIHDAEIGRRGHRCDWRASKALLEISSPQRYGSQPQVDPVAQPVVAISVVSSWWPKPPARPPAVTDARAQGPSVRFELKCCKAVTD